MSGFDWFLVAWWLFGTGTTIAIIGKPRKPINPPTAVIVTAINLGFIAALLLTRGVL